MPHTPAPAQPIDPRHADQQARAQQIVAALIRDLQHGLGKLNPLRHVEPRPAAVDLAASRVLELLREVAREEAAAAVRAELDAADLAVLARTGDPDDTPNTA